MVTEVLFLGLSPPPSALFSLSSSPLLSVHHFIILPSPLLASENAPCAHTGVIIEDSRCISGERVRARVEKQKRLDRQGFRSYGTLNDCV